MAMELTSLRLESFKKVQKAEIQLRGINVLVGGNNSGKSSVLQGIHFSIAAAIAAKMAEKQTFPQDSLLFCPARQFEHLRHGAPYSNQSHFGFLEIKARFPEDNAELAHLIRIYRGRNEGNVGCVRTGATKLGQAMANADAMFTIYVPGLAGIPQVEQFRSESVVRRGVASGDANLYLRNVLLIIKERDLMTLLVQRMRLLFPNFYLLVNFDKKSDIYIEVWVSTTGPAGRRPLELVGTGVLQALQIFAYVTLWAPKLLLLDEPDSHLHPDNQVLLAAALRLVAQETATKILISTHSRHLVESLYEDSNFVWLKEGKVFQQGIAPDILPILLDLGAIDNFDKIRAGHIKTVFLTEDTILSFIRTLVFANGFSEKETLFYSYRTSSRLDSALILAEFLHAEYPGTKIVIHRDRDFMTDQEVSEVSKKILAVGATPFITEGSDVESYFLNPEHLATLLQADIAAVVKWLDDLAKGSHNDLVATFIQKRSEVVQQHYKNNRDKAPSATDLMSKEIPLPASQRRGKDMLAKARNSIQTSERADKHTFNPMTPTVFLKARPLEAIHLI
ncbi:AAA family ATPase [Herbaspirillum sp. LeCh32-8]|uniref:AAA family ATPase n=1 Tax=Herbaspirillum sp. LeCh32-8 TaxID=2821356 RepID=UPI001AEAABB1|nr:AAA family ATPase [Herbaspirillum sp. LeCh32-8]MBP0597733.1 AAA family ATPase [Herbaspirillum sp. LeCh32-8]